MPKRFLQILLLSTIALLACRPASGAESTSPPRIEEEMWALPFPLPVLAYVVRPLGDGPFPLVVMNHGIARRRAADNVSTNRVPGRRILVRAARLFRNLAT